MGGDARSDTSKSCEIRGGFEGGSGGGKRRASGSRVSGLRASGDELEISASIQE